MADSRGRLLEPLLSAPPDREFEFIFEDEASINTAKNLVSNRLAKGSYSCVYLMIGIYSITSKDDGVRYLSFDTAKETVESITRDIRTTLKELDDSFITPIIFCTFPGVNLLTVNNQQAVGTHPKQAILNEALMEINDYLIDLNLHRGYTTPKLSTAIHKCHKKNQDRTRKFRHHYCRLVDGINPAKSTLLDWCKKLEENFGQFIFDFD